MNLWMCLIVCLSGLVVADQDNNEVIRHKRTFGSLLLKNLADSFGYQLVPKPAVVVQLTVGASTPATPQPKPVMRQPPPKMNPPTNPPSTNPPPAKMPPSPQPREVVLTNFSLNFNWNKNIPVLQPLPSTLPNPTSPLSPPSSPPPPPLPPSQPPSTVPPKTVSLMSQPKIYINAFYDKGHGEIQRVPAADADEFYSNTRLNIPYNKDENQQSTDDNKSDYDEYDEEPSKKLEYINYDESVGLRQSHSSNPRSVNIFNERFNDAIGNFWKNSPVIKNNYNQVNLNNNNNPHKIYNDYMPLRIISTSTNNKIPVDDKRTYNEAEKFDFNIGVSENKPTAEKTTTTEDPNEPLIPKILPPTENNPWNIDTITVRVPPIYKVEKPRKLHISDEINEGFVQNRNPKIFDRFEGRESRRFVQKYDHPFENPDDDLYDYFGTKNRKSREELEILKISPPTPTLYPDLVRLENPTKWLNDDEIENSKSAKITSREYKNNFVTVHNFRENNPNFEGQSYKFKH